MCSTGANFVFTGVQMSSWGFLHHCFRSELLDAGGHALWPIPHCHESAKLPQPPPLKQCADLPKHLAALAAFSLLLPTSRELGPLFFSVLQGPAERGEGQ